jgi:hypothetical protein
MSANSKLRKSRDKWKRKSSSGSAIQRDLRKEVARLKRDRDRYKKAAAEAKKKQNPSVANQDKAHLIFIALQLFLVARLSFRAVSRALAVVAPYLGITKPPCTQTIINWVARLSVTKLQQPTTKLEPFDGDPFSNGFIWILDTSIGLGSGKILAVLGLDARHHQRNDCAPSLKNVSCLGVSVSTSWTGVAIADFLQEMIGLLGRPAALLKDGGTDLAKAAEVLNDRKFPILSIDDISHKIANLFKHEYAEHQSFATFLSACGEASKKLKQTLLACLVPPKTSIKARFMNLHRLVIWADRVLKHSPVGRASKGSLVEKLRTSLGLLPECRSFIARFLRDALPILECQKLLKTQGLSHKTHQECKILLSVLPETSSIRNGFLDWAQDQLAVASTLQLADQGLPICSDVLESLFGVGKRHGTGETKDAYQIAKRLPAECGQLTFADAQRVRGITVKHQNEIMGTSRTLIKQRREVLAHPGRMETLAIDNATGKLELISTSKNREKKRETICLPTVSEKTSGLKTKFNKCEYEPKNTSPPGLCG